MRESKAEIGSGVTLSTTFAINSSDVALTRVGNEDVLFPAKEEGGQKGRNGRTKKAQDVAEHVEMV